MRILGKFYDKNQDFSKLTLTILMKVVPDGVKMSRIKILKARGPGKFCTSRTTKTKVGHGDALSRELFAQSMVFDVS